MVKLWSCLRPGLWLCVDQQSVNVGPAKAHSKLPDALAIGAVRPTAVYALQHRYHRTLSSRPWMAAELGISVFRVTSCRCKVRGHRTWSRSCVGAIHCPHHCTCAIAPLVGAIMPFFADRYRHTWHMPRCTLCTYLDTLAAPEPKLSFQLYTAPSFGGVRSFRPKAGIWVGCRGARQA